MKCHWAQSGRCPRHTVRRCTEAEPGWNVFLSPDASMPCCQSKSTHIHFASHMRVEVPKGCVRAPHFSLTSRRMWAAVESRVLFFFFFFQRFDALLYVCWPRLFSTAALPLQGRGRDITLSIRPYCLRRLQPRQRDLSLWFMHQVNIVLSCLVWSAAYISCPTFI